MILKLKSFIYRQTGIYLAHREELAYINSEEFWKSFAKIISKEGMRPRDVQGLLIGLWQVDHGFHRPYNRKNEAKKLKKRNLRRMKES